MLCAFVALNEILACFIAVRLHAFLSLASFATEGFQVLHLFAKGMHSGRLRDGALGRSETSLVENVMRPTMPATGDMLWMRWLQKMANPVIKPFHPSIGMIRTA